MDFFETLVRYEVGLWDAVDGALRKGGFVSAAQHHALTILDRHGDAARVLDVSAEIGITVGAASKLVDRLERGGLVERRPHPTDGRSSLISLTALGSTSLAAATAARSEVLAELLDPAAAEAALRAIVVLQDRLDHRAAEVVA
jgi:DNA-binding MarR family transcriptional regulator